MATWLRIVSLHPMQGGSILGQRKLGCSVTLLYTLRLIVCFWLKFQTGYNIILGKVDLARMFSKMGTWVGLDLIILIH